MKRLLTSTLLMLVLPLLCSCQSESVALELPQGSRVHELSVVTSGGASDSIPVRLARGEVFDVVILSRSPLNRLTKKGAGG